MSVALSNRFQGKRRCPTTLPRPRHAVPRAPARARCAPACHLCAPGGRRGLRRAQEAGADPGGAQPRKTPHFPGRLFVSSRREGVRLAQSPAGEEAGRDQPGKREPPPSLSQPRRQGSLQDAGAARGADLSPKLPTSRGPTSSSPRATPNFLPPPLLCLRV